MAEWIGRGDHGHGYEHSFTCGICQHRESWTSSAACIAASAWHLSEMHRATWLSLTGRDQPRSERPEKLGIRFEAWESQL